MKRALVGFAFLLVILALLAGCTGQQAQGTNLKIGVVASLTGPASTTGTDVWQSAQLAADEINAKGGVFVRDLGRKVPIQLVAGDDASTREGGQTAVTRMITQDGVDLLVGGFSSAVVSAHQSTVADHGVPYIITGASSPIVTHRTDINTSYMFHHAPTTDASGSATTLFIADTIRSAINGKFGYPASRPLRLSVIYQDSPYGKGQLDAIRNTIAANNLTMTVVSEDSFTMGESDFRTVLTGVKKADPDVVYVAAFLNEQTPLMNQARRDVGLDKIFIAVEPNDDPAYYSGIGRNGEYSIIQSRFSPYAIPGGSTASAVRSFITGYDTKFHGYPGMMGAATYEGVYIAAQAVENAGSLDRTKIRDALAGLQMPQMVEAMENQTISFSPDFRESSFSLDMEQLTWDDSVNQTRPKIVWPASLKERDFVLPDWFVPGKG
jgi:branched-chain amino acid transport system substrate-binding protein